MNARTSEPLPALDRALQQRGPSSSRVRDSVGAAPVLMVSTPRSVLAAASDPDVLSTWPPTGAVASMPACVGRGVEFWATAALADWPPSCLADENQTKFFEDMFSGMSDFARGTTLLDVLNLPDTRGRVALAKCVVAALLNVRKGWTAPAVLSEATARAIWSSCRTGSFFEPTAGVRWYADYSLPGGSGGCIAWLKSTMN